MKYRGISNIASANFAHYFKSNVPTFLTACV